MHYRLQTLREPIPQARVRVLYMTRSSSPIELLFGKEANQINAAAVLAAKIEGAFNHT
jgi:hypothetical protein